MIAGRRCQRGKVKAFALTRHSGEADTASVKDKIPCSPSDRRLSKLMECSSVHVLGAGILCSQERGSSLARQQDVSVGNVWVGKQEQRVQ